MRWWPFRDAPEHLKRYDNGGDEDWLIHVPVEWRDGPMPACETHGRDFAWWGRCDGCDDVMHADPPLKGRSIPWDHIATAGYQWYEESDGSLVYISHHA